MKRDEMHTLLPCPFCGGAFLMSQEPHDNHPVAGKFYLYHKYGELGSPARKCLIDVPGHFDSAEKAATAWNERAEVATEPLEWHASPLRENTWLAPHGFGENYVASRYEGQGEWIPWAGGKAPAPKSTEVEIEFRSRVTSKAQSGNLRWRHDGGRSDIIAYRVVGAAK